MDKLEEYLLEHFKEEYQFEQERTNGIRDRVSFVVGFVTILGGLLWFLMSDFPHAWHCGRTLWFYVPFCFGVLGFLLCVGHIFYVIGWNTNYAALPSKDDIQKFGSNLRAGVVAGMLVEQHALDKLREGFLNTYREAARFNEQANRQIGIVNQNFHRFVHSLIRIASLVYLREENARQGTHASKTIESVQPYTCYESASTS